MVTDYAVTTYMCTICDEDGNEYEFEAYGLESSTGRLTKIGSHLTKKLFPQLSNQHVQYLARSDKVDFMIEMYHPSWHPIRAESASSSQGDLWMYRGKFWSCIGCRHPEIMRKHNALIACSLSTMCIMPLLTRSGKIYHMP